MKKLLSIIFLFIVLPFALFSQEKKADNFRFMDLGIGGGYGHGAFNVSFANGLEGVIASFIDYNMYIDKSDHLSHEINIKLGPYCKINEYSYFAVSSGISFVFNYTQPPLKNVYTYQQEDNYQLNVPIQVKFNAKVYKNFCIGFKGTLNKRIKKSDKDHFSGIVYVSMGF
jgi:hypothetical protein